MEPAKLQFSKEKHSQDDDLEDTLKLRAVKPSRRIGTLEKEPLVTTDFTQTTSTPEQEPGEAAVKASTLEKEYIEAIETIKTASLSGQTPIEEIDTDKTAALWEQTPIDVIDTAKPAHILEWEPLEAITTLKIPSTPVPASITPRTAITRGKAALLAALLCILVLHALNMGSMDFIGPQGWAYVLGGSSSTGDTNLLQDLNQQLRQRYSSTPGATAGAIPRLTPQQYINDIMQSMTLDQKLGQMMIVQFVGPSYSLDLSTMLSQYNVGAVLIFAANNNIVDKAQLKGLIQQMQSHRTIPLAVAIDQEGGRVDRLINLDGPRPSAASIGATNNPSKAMAAGIQDAKDLTYYGINLNLAPVVDVTNVYNPQLYLRTYGNNPTLVTKMAQAYLNGLQQSGKVLGTLKHFPGLGDVATDPHCCVTYLTRSESSMEAIDWAPYRALIEQGNVYSIMVTHEILTAIDNSKPSSLSYPVVTGILRNKLGFQGVIMTDSLTMQGLLAYATEDQAAVQAVKAGCDLLMGATSARDVATMIEGLKQAVKAGEISQQRIDESVRRILMLKYQMELLPLPVTSE